MMMMMMMMMSLQLFLQSTILLFCLFLAFDAQCCGLCVKRFWRWKCLTENQLMWLSMRQRKSQSVATM